jgi:hypothetical protein
VPVVFTVGDDLGLVDREILSAATLIIDVVIVGCRIPRTPEAATSTAVSFLRFG